MQVAERKEPLTWREQNVFDYIVNYMQENGFCPSQTEIKTDLHYASVATCSEVLDILEYKGYIERPFKKAPRAIRILGMHYVREGGIA